MAPSFDLSSASGLSAFNDFLATRSYVSGYAFSSDDAALFAECPAPFRDSHPHVFRWYLHIAHLVGMPQVIAAKATQPPAEAQEEKKEEEDNDDFDMGWDDDEEEEEEDSGSKSMSRAERIKAAQDAKKKKNVGRTQVILDIKPSEIEVDLNQLWRDICATPINGVTWGEGFEIEPVAFGICKLVMSCVMVDDEVGMDDITEAIENTFEDLVQSVDVAAMNKV